ncbi:related to translocation protein sec62 [Pseudozyma flocculosa]|uniref:Translocation protein SEC62 n=1 Tax=Pseudozyma flocculosa TaxID=84751 RepID=A0A5C3F338_9BASI|nr:related to translocation protein sec62 [Pseudozyma flocculosa]
MGASGLARRSSLAALSWPGWLARLVEPQAQARGRAGWPRRRLVPTLPLLLLVPPPPVSLIDITIATATIATATTAATTATTTAQIIRQRADSLVLHLPAPRFAPARPQESQSAAPPQVRQIVNYLRNNAGLKTKVGVLNGKRVDYFKGSAAVKAIVAPAYSKLKDVPKIENEEHAQALLHSIIPFAFFLRVDRGPSSGGKDAPKVVQVNPQQMFSPDMVRYKGVDAGRHAGNARVLTRYPLVWLLLCPAPQYYAWLFEGSQLGLKLAGVGMVVVMLAGVMFPLWPPSMRLGVWYLSIGVLGLIGLFFAIAIVRLIFWVISLVVLRPGVWIFPNLFEDVGFVDSFIPLWAWDVPPPKKEKKSKKAAKALKSEKAAVGARQQAIANLPGAPQQPAAPRAPEATAESQPAAEAPAKNAAGGAKAPDSLNDIN